MRKIPPGTERRTKDGKVTLLAANYVKENWYSIARHGKMKPEPRQKNLRKMEAYR